MVLAPALTLLLLSPPSAEPGVPAPDAPLDETDQADSGGLDAEVDPALLAWMSSLSPDAQARLDELSEEELDSLVSRSLEGAELSGPSRTSRTATSRTMTPRTSTTTNCSRT